MLWCYVPVMHTVGNLRIRILLYYLIVAQMAYKLHFMDLQYFLHKCPAIGSCQASYEFILELHSICNVHFNIIPPYIFVPSALFTPDYLAKILYLFRFSPLPVTCDFS